MYLFAIPSINEIIQGWYGIRYSPPDAECIPFQHDLKLSGEGSNGCMLIFTIMPIFHTSPEICAMRSLASTTPNVLSLIFSDLERYLLWPRFRCGRCQRDFRFNVTMAVPMFCTDCIASIPMPRYTVKYCLKKERNDVGTLPL